MSLKKSLAAVLIAGLLGALGAPALAQDKVLRIVPQSDLKILDPIWTTAFITRNHGYAVYDTLFGVDAKGKVQGDLADPHLRDDEVRYLRPGEAERQHDRQGEGELKQRYAALVAPQFGQSTEERTKVHEQFLTFAVP